MKFKEFLNYSEFKKDDVYTRGKWNPGLFDLDKKKLKKLKYRNSYNTGYK